MRSGCKLLGASTLAFILGLSLVYVATISGLVLGTSAAPAADEPVLLFTIGVHVEPLGAEVSQLVGEQRPPQLPSDGRPRPDYHNPQIFQRHVQYLYELAEVVERHGGKLVVQVQSPFTTCAAKFGSSILADLEARGHEIALHFHEDAHLGKDPERLPPDIWCAVMQEEIEFIHQAGVVGPVRYWSGGNLYPDLLVAAACAGLEINSDWKDPHTQSSHELVIGVNPWRPAGGPNPDDMSAFATHDPNGPVIYLPDGELTPTHFRDKRRIMAERGPAAWFEVLRDDLLRSLAAARPDRVNVHHFTVHPGEFSPELIDRFLAEVVDPLVAQGKVRWATFSEMADAFIAWEKEHPGIDPRSAEGAAAPPDEPDEPTCRGYITFAVNVHDFKHVEESADTLLRLIDLFEKYGVRGDFYLTAPQVHFYLEQRPDVIERLRQSGMTISYHVRPPHPTVPGFDRCLEGLSPEELERTLRDYETYRLDLVTGGLLRDQPGGYSFVKEIFGRAPVVASVPNPRWRAAVLPVLAELGARMTLIYHETVTDPENPFEWVHGLLVRPSDFSVTRWSVPGRPQEAFWWNMLDTPFAEEYNPTLRLKQLLGEWSHERPPFITVLIHENNFYRQGGTPWALVYYEDPRKGRPKSPPFDLDAPDPSRPRSPENQAAIWAAYEELVAYAAEHLCVVTSADIVRMASSQN